ncbi:MAG: N-acetylmuramoyl-L-alanine amidase [Clostridiales bacterium]|nr:N-acetylmuramoyl-L-alanine amidase [Clostridiales bacterium]
MAEMKRIVIDAGHGGAEPGAVYNERKEKDDNLRLALAVGQILADDGFDVAYTRVTDIYNTPFEKAMIANHADADYFLSLHRNAMPVPGTASGVETLVYEDSGIAGAMAKNINARLEKAGFTNLGVQERPGLIVLRHTRMPAVLVETGFLDNDIDNRLFDEQFDAIAAAIAAGVVDTLREEERPPEYYQIQVGLYRNRENAEKQANTLRSQGFPAFIVYKDGNYSVRVGAFLNLDNAARTEQLLHNYGYATYMLQEAAQ